MLNPRTYQLLVGIFASLGSILFGYDLGVIGGSVAAPSFKSNFNNPPANEIGAVVSVFTGGAFIGAALAGPTGDWIGRRLTIMTGAIIFLLGGGLQTGAMNLGYLYAGRAIAGVGVGFLVMIIPLYQAELAHPDIRGRITSLQQLLLAVGSLIASWCTYGTNKNIAPTDNAQWRIPLGIQNVPAVFLALLILVFPESPRWLISKGKEELGLHTLARLHSNGDQSDPWVQTEFEQIKAAIERERHETAGSYMELFRDRSSFRRLILVTALQASVQLTGVSAIQYFSPTIYGTLGIDTESALKYQAIGSVLALVSIFATALTIDRVGRRWPLILGNLVNCGCFIVVTACIASFSGVGFSSQQVLGWVFIATNWVYQISFSYTCGTLSWIIPAEIFDTKTRSKGVSLGTMVSFAFNTMIGQITEPAIQTSSWRYFLLFIICNFTNAIFFWAFLPETAKLPLEDMNYLFSNAPWFVPTMQKRHLEPVDAERQDVDEKSAYKSIQAKRDQAHVEQVSI